MYWLLILVVLLSGMTLQSMHDEDMNDDAQRTEWQIEYCRELEDESSYKQGIRDGFAFLEGYARFLKLTGSFLVEITKEESN